MKRYIILALLTLCICLISGTIYAQKVPDPGSVGISAFLQSDQKEILLPIWISRRVVIAPLINIFHQEGNATDIRIGVKPRWYQHIGSDFAGYVGMQALIQEKLSVDQTFDHTNYIVGVNTGGEYFFSPHFSMGVEALLNVFFEQYADDAVSTGAGITGTYYF